MMADWKDRNVIVYRSPEFDVRLDKVTDRIVIRDTLADEIMVVPVEMLYDIVDVIDTMRLSAL